METMHARRQAWAQHVQAWRDSGLTQVAYCQQHELKPKALAYWIRRSKQTATPLTLVPLALYFADGKVKVELALARGKQAHDKRQDMAKRDAQREVTRELGRRAKGMS